MKRRGRKGGGLKGLIISGMWILVAIGVLLAVAQTTEINSLSDGIDFAKEKAIHYSECIPSGECGLAAIIKDIGNSEGPVGSGQQADNSNSSEEVIATDVEEGKIPQKTDQGLNYDNILISRDVKGYRGPVKGEPYVNEAGLVNAASSLNMLNEIDVVDKADDVEYSRTDWKHWIGLKERPCWTIRNEVLHRDAKPGTVTYMDKKGNVTENYDEACAIGKPVEVDGKKKIDTENAGEWIDPYSGRKMTKSSDIDIDHVVPLSYAARHGGQSWSSEVKEEFANDLDNLLATSAKENRAKGDKGPGDYMPKYKAYHCQYAKTFTTVAYKYELSITKSDHKVLKNTLESCAY